MFRIIVDWDDGDESDQRVVEIAGRIYDMLVSQVGVDYYMTVSDGVAGPVLLTVRAMSLQRQAAQREGLMHLGAFLAMRARILQETADNYNAAAQAIGEHVALIAAQESE